MNILINGQPHPTPADGQTVREVLAALAKELSASRHVIFSVAVDGRNLPDGTNSVELAGLKTYEVSELSIESTTLRTLALDTLKSTAGHFQLLVDEIGEIAKLLQQHGINAALNRLTNLTEVWSQINQAVNNACRLLGVEFGEVLIAEPGTDPPQVLKMSELLAKISDHLRQALQLMEAEDYFELADLLDHDLAILTRRCEEGVLRVLVENDKLLN